MFTLNTIVAGLSMLSPVSGIVTMPDTILDTSVAQRAPAEEITGSVQSVDWDAMTFSVLVDEKEAAKRVAWNEKTSFTLDGEASTAKEVLVAMGDVKVSVGEEGFAASVARVTE